jgi:uncharacterized protein YggL (DUF469 family)
LRKKLRLREFRESGFGVTFALTGDSPAEARDTLLDRFITEAIEARDLMLCGVGDARWFNGFIVARKRYASPTEDDRAAVETWLCAERVTMTYEVGPLTDAWERESSRREGSAIIERTNR